MLLRKPLAAAVLLLAAVLMPQLLWLGAHALVHHEHGEHSEHGPEWSGFAASLVHGHEHGDEVPDHEHRLVPSPTFRPDPPQDLHAPATASESPQAGQSALSGAASWQSGTCLTGSSPPRLHLLCTLLI